MNNNNPPGDPSLPRFDQRRQQVYGPQINIGRDQNNQFLIEGGAHPKCQIDLNEALVRLAQMPSDHLPPLANLPANSRMVYGWNQHFVGRQTELLALANALLGGKDAAIVSAGATSVAATGMGGVGKTQLASAFVHYYAQYFLGGVFWISFADPASVAVQVASCAEMMDDLPLWVSQLPIMERLPHVQRAWQEPLPRLLVFDNCEEPELLKTWRPKSGGCRILLTSRRSHWNRASGLTSVAVGVLPRRQSVELLQKFMPTPTTAGWDVALLTEIAAEVGDLPLALHMAGSYLQLLSPDLAPRQYLQQLRQPNLLDHESLQEGDDSPTDHELHVARTFALSFAQLGEEVENDSHALKLLACAALLAPGATIPRLLLRTAAGLADEKSGALAAKALRRLIDLGLLEADANHDLRLHRLLCHFVTKEFGEELAEWLTDVEAAVLALANEQNNAGDPRPLLAWQAQLRFVTDRAAQRQDENAAALCNTLGFHLDTMGDYAAARPYYERALAIWEEVLGAKHPATATSLNNLGGLLDSMGEYAAARPYYERALAIREEVLGAKHPATATSLNNLGVLAYYAGDKPTAADYLARALAINEAVLGAEHPDTQLTHKSLQNVLTALAGVAEAESEEDIPIQSNQRENYAAI